MTVRNIDEAFVKVKQQVKGGVNTIESAFKEMGDRALAYCLSRSQETSWHNRTGNLRSSIGYIIFKNGLKVGESGFELVGSGIKGVSEGRRFAESLKSEFPKGFALVIVAGMEYAAYVEAIESRDVLASTDMYIEANLPSVIRQLNEIFER